MYQKKWFVFIDFTDGGDSESWSPWYMTIHVADTENEAKWLGDYAIAHWMNEEFDNDGEFPDYGEYMVREEDAAHQEV